MAIKGASLLPQDFASGGALPDGDYTITEARAVVFNYDGKGPDTPAMFVEFKDENGTTLSQHYSAGKVESLVPSDDGKKFLHPSGEEAKIQKQSNLAAFIASIINAGFPVAKMSDEVSCFEGTRVTIVNQAQPKRPGLKDQVEGKTIPLVTKVLALPGEKKSGTAAKGAAVKPATQIQQTAAIPASSDGNLDETAIGVIQEVLSSAQGNTLTRVKLGTNIMLKLSKDPALKAQMPNIKKMAQDPVWLQAHQDEGGWQLDGDNVLLPG